jgi:hypothetical protein
VLWAIDGVLGHVLILPMGWFDPHFEVGYNTNAALTYVLISGAFFAGVASCLTVWLNARKA